MTATPPNPDFSDLLSALNAAGARSSVVGAYAVGAHGSPRATGALDVGVANDAENASRVLRARAAFGAPLDQVSLDDFRSDDLIFQVGVVPNRVVILTGLSGVTFDEAWPDRVPATVEAVPSAVIARGHLIRNTRASGRPKDLLDADGLERDWRR
jgi:hypothetical protein